MDTQTTSEVDKEILEIFKSLPQIIQDAITKSGWETILRGIVSKYHLRIDYGTKLENMTFALMMGVMEPKEYFDLIHNDFGLDKETADMLFQDIDDKIFSRIEEMTMMLETQQTLEEPEKEEKHTQTFVKEDRGLHTKDDEILTLTREEILRDIEDPEKIKMTDTLPDLKDSFVMPKSASLNEQPKPANVSAPVPVINKTVEVKEEQISASMPLNKTVEVREEQIPSNLPTEKVTPIQKEEPKIVNPKPLDPVDLGLTNKISTTSKDYKTFDPYREPIE